jgi:hypothetical protein
VNAHHVGWPSVADPATHQEDHTFTRPGESSALEKAFHPSDDGVVSGGPIAVAYPERSDSPKELHLPGDCRLECEYQYRD